MLFKNIIQILIFSFLFNSQEGMAKEKFKEILFTKINKILIINTENDVCSFDGNNHYKLQTRQTDKSFDLVCDVQKPGSKFNSVIPIDLIEDFKYPERIQEDIRSWHSKSNFNSKERKLSDPVLKTSIKTIKHEWGNQYLWETSSSGSTKYSYLHPTGANYCIQVKVAGLEKMTFNIKSR